MKWLSSAFLCRGWGELYFLEYKGKHNTHLEALCMCVIQVCDHVHTHTYDTDSTGRRSKLFLWFLLSKISKYEYQPWLLIVQVCPAYLFIFYYL